MQKVVGCLKKQRQGIKTAYKVQTFPYFNLKGVEFFFNVTFCSLTLSDIAFFVELEWDNIYYTTENMQFLSFLLAW